MLMGCVSPWNGRFCSTVGRVGPVVSSFDSTKTIECRMAITLKSDYCSSAARGSANLTISC